MTHDDTAGSAGMSDAGDTIEDRTSSSVDAATNNDTDELGDDTDELGDNQTDRRNEIRYRRERNEATARADQLARELFALRVETAGVLQDPTDMPYSPDLVTADDVAAALVELVERKPYLRRPVAGGDIGQGAGSPAGGEMSLLRMFGR